ncbi:hypothetical protein BSL82_15795 [Tardibacter chloracetimidivorans]|uniref:Uncharacterized protein n=1 Tax=Tardibacter chloracetimidivorans TaxID=1921510 RepID=A0A1L3ZY55_9SPHN|nr:hypothetical protein [Tardibacter chloracetimidivorans]API60568.1 hypothetical protein BSL82_15795 [Tardibacter chloracetimidivorans]
MKQKIERLRSLMEKATPGEWFHDTEDGEDGRGKVAFRSIYAAQGEHSIKLFDALNSDAACIIEESDGDEYGPWIYAYDEVSDKNAALIVEAVNALPDLLSHIDALEARVARDKVPMDYGTANDGPKAIELSPPTSLHRLGTRAEAAERALAEAVKERDALRSASTIIRQRDEAVEVLEEVAKEALIHADLKIRSFPKADQSDVEFIRKALIKIAAFLTKRGEK